MKYFIQSKKDLLERCVSMNYVPSYLIHRPDVLSNHLELFRKDFELMEKYIYYREPIDTKSPIQCPITVLGANDDDYVSKNQLEDWSFLSSSSLKGNNPNLSQINTNLSQLQRVNVTQTCNNFDLKPVTNYPKL